MTLKGTGLTHMLSYFSSVFADVFTVNIEPLITTLAAFSVETILIFLSVQRHPIMLLC